MKLFDSAGPDILFTPGMILFGMVYTYMPFMLLPTVLGLSLVPRDVVDAALDMGATRFQAWYEVELPLATPGLLIGMLLTFVLAAGAVSEAKVLGGQSIIVITHDIEIAFTYSQNWPLGSALAVLLMLLIGGLTLFALSKLDLDRILGRR
jgi:spermidine/putrescine transport system permease protein